jgi:hypothetical protein
MATNNKVLLLCKQPRSSSQGEIQTKNTRNDNKENNIGQQPSTSSAHSNALPMRAADQQNFNIYTAQPQRPVLQRGLTELVLSSSNRPSREPRVVQTRPGMDNPIPKSLLFVEWNSNSGLVIF